MACSTWPLSIEQFPVHRVLVQQPVAPVADDADPRPCVLVEPPLGKIYKASHGSKLSGHVRRCGNSATKWVYSPLELIPEFLGQIIGLGFVLYLNNQVQGDNMIDE